MSFIDRYLEFINMGKVAFHRLLLPPVNTVGFLTPQTLK